MSAARHRCGLPGCGFTVTPEAAAQFDGCCSAGHAAQVAFQAQAEADPPTVRLRPAGMVAADAQARAARPPRGRRWLLVVALLVLFGVGWWSRGPAPAAVVSSVVPVSSSAPAVDSSAVATAPSTSVRRARPSVTRTPIRSRTVQPSRTPRSSVPRTTGEDG